jgi:cyclo(L-tyrosyl-L-tyrosyl) synthase
MSPVRTPPALFRAEPVGPHSEQVYRRGDHVVVGLSPGNSYYSGDRIRQLARWALDHFDAVQLFTWMEPYAWYSLGALGYDEDYALAKAGKAFRNVRGRAVQALHALGIDDPEAHLLTWPALEANPEYRRLRDQVEHAFHHDETFHDACVAEAEAFLRRHALEGFHGSMPWSQRVETAAAYVLAELPLSLDTAGMLGGPSSTFVYHRHTGLFAGLFAGDFPSLQPARRQARVVLTEITPAVTAAAAAAATAPPLREQAS